MEYRISKLLQYTMEWNYQPPTVLRLHPAYTSTDNGCQSCFASFSPRYLPQVRLKAAGLAWLPPFTLPCTHEIHECYHGVGHSFDSTRAFWGFQPAEQVQIVAIRESRMYSDLNRLAVTRIMVLVMLGCFFPKRKWLLPREQAHCMRRW